MANALPIPRLARTEAEPLLATIGNTPLLRLAKIEAEFPGIEIYGKAEFFNPGGSVKDRAALNMILDGERTGRLNHSRTILDATSGNTGIAYAMIGAKGYQVKLCFPATPRRAQTDPESLRRGDGLLRPGRRLRRSHPPVPQDLRRIPTRTSIPTSTTIPPTGKRTSTAPAPRSSSRPTADHPLRRRHGHQRHLHRRHRACKRDLPDVKCISAQPSTGFHGLEGLKHMPTAIVPGILRRHPGR